MPSQSRALEASFESSDKQRVPLGTDPVPMLEDFDSFFEKLNSLDRAEWRKAHPANPERPAERVGGKADPLAGLRAAGQAKQTQIPGKVPAAPRPARMRLPGSVRFALTALALFAVGMGIGWAALSLPNRATGDDAATAAKAPVPAQLIDLKSEPLLGTTPAADKSATLAAIVPLTDVTAAPNEGASESAGAPAPDGSQGVSKPFTAGGETGAGTAKSVSAAAAAPGGKAQAARKQAKPAKSAILTAKQADSASPSAVPAQVAPAAAAHTAPAPAVAPAGGVHYAVQVGACRSTRCVENYRQLVTAHLPSNSESVRIVPVAAEGKDGGVQRVRVEPLDKSQAQQLKAALIQADARLSGAYVVDLHP